MYVTRAGLTTSEHVGELTLGNVHVDVLHHHTRGLVLITIARDAETFAGPLRPLDAIAAHGPKPCWPAICAYEFQALRIKVTLNVERRNHRTITVALLIEPSCSQDLTKRFPDGVCSHVARDPAGQRQPHLHFPAPTGQEEIEAVALTVHADGEGHGPQRDHASLRKLLVWHKVPPVQSCPRDQRKLGLADYSQKLE